MYIVTLVENTSNQKNLTSKHGLCLYIETKKHKVLFDLGPDETYLRNAKQLGINIGNVDTVIISHGHKDHGGGLHSFLKCNKSATIYIQQNAFLPHFMKAAFLKIPIGIPSGLQNNARLVKVNQTLKIDDELFLFSDVIGQFKTKSNRVLLQKNAAGYGQDLFEHEQNLLLFSGGKRILFSGCAHRGIANILKTAEKYTPIIDIAVGGFHLYNPATKATEPERAVSELAQELNRRNTAYYTCHCTGMKAYAIMEKVLQYKLHYLSTGDIIEI